MKMQRSTAARLVAELNASLETGDDNIILLSEIATALINDALARGELSEALDQELSNSK